MTPYTLTAYDDNGLETWSEKHRNLADCLSAVASHHRIKTKSPLFCGLSTVDVEGRLRQLSLTKTSILGGETEGCDYLIQLCEF